MSSSLLPSIDLNNNPFYCPAVPAHNFLSSLRRKRDKFRSKLHTYRSRKFVLRPFAAALDRCLFRGGGDSGDEKRNVFPTTATTTSASRRGLWRQSLVRFRSDSGGEENDDDDDDDDDESGNELENLSFGTIRHAHIPSFDESDAPLGTRTLGSLITTTRRPKSATATLTLLEKLASVTDTNGKNPRTTTHTATAASPTSLSLHLKRKSNDDNTSGSSSSDFKSLRTTKRAKSDLSVSNASFYVTVRREKLNFARTTPTPLASGASSPEPPVVSVQEKNAKEGAAALRAGAHISAPRFTKPFHAPVANMQEIEREDLLDLARGLQGERQGAYMRPTWSDSLALEELFGSIPASKKEGTNEMQDLVLKLDSIFPGVRLKERVLEKLKEGATHQALVNFLAENGYLNERALELFRACQVTRISLSESLKDANGLNLIEDGLFFVFSKPNSFRSLTTLSLDGLRLQTPMLTHIQHLPKLSILSLFDAGIDNEAIYLLVPLRYTLDDLNVARNPQVDDDAVPALLMLSNLSYLSIAETSIGMPGARRLVKDRSEGAGKRTLVDLPHCCHEYVENMERKYLVDPQPPLITNPSLCNRLSVAALKRNLSAHAAVNREIPTGGTKREIVQRLEDLLETRLADLEVRRMIRYPDFEGGPVNSVEEECF